MNEAAVFDDNGKWSKLNTYFAITVMGEYKLGGFQLAILLYIVGNYNRNFFSYKAQKGCKVSYTELANKCNCPTATIKKAIKVLLEEELIIRINSEERKGRKSYCYIPNTANLKSITKRYLQNVSEDKDNE